MNVLYFKIVMTDSPLKMGAKYHPDSTQKHSSFFPKMWGRFYIGDAYVYTRRVWKGAKKIAWFCKGLKGLCLRIVRCTKRKRGGLAFFGALPILQENFLVFSTGFDKVKWNWGFFSRKVGKLIRLQKKMS